MIPKRRFFGNLLLLVAAISLSGCASIPAGKFAALSESGQELLTGTTKTFDTIEELQDYFEVVTTTAPLHLEGHAHRIDGLSYDLAPELEYREAALKVLVKYFTLLEALASKDFDGRIDKASEELAVRLKSLVETAAPESRGAKKAAGVLATVVNTIGRGLTRRKRLAALRSVMDAAQPHINELAELLAGSNTKLQLGTKILLKTILKIANKPPYALDEPQRFAFRAENYRRIREYHVITQSLDSISKSAENLPEAHRQLRASLDGRKTDLSALREIMKEVERIKKFYRKVK